MTVLTSSTLNEIGCMAPDCPGGHVGNDELHLGASCHPDSAVRVWYLKNVITLECAECEKEICKIQVA